MFIIARLCSHSTAIIPALKRELGSREVARTYVAFYLSQISEIHMEYNYRLSRICIYKRCISILEDSVALCKYILYYSAFFHDIENSRYFDKKTFTTNLLDSSYFKIPNLISLD